MGLFKTEYCPVCGDKVGLMGFRIKNKVAVCFNCICQAEIDKQLLPFISEDEFIKRIDERKKNALAFRQFSPTREVKAAGYYFREDANLQRWYVSTEKKPKNPQLLRYDEIIDFHLEEDGTTISSGGLGRAIVGGVLLGGLGAVVGAVTGKKEAKKKLTSLNFIISLNNRYLSNINVSLLNSPCKTGSWAYDACMQSAQKLSDFFTYLRAQIATPPPLPAFVTQESEPEKILKFKQLLDEGIITQEEFDLKKKQILGI